MATIPCNHQTMETLSRSYIPNVLLLCSQIILAIMLSQGICSSFRIQCNERDHYLLLNFKHTVVDPSDAILSSWSDERNCCEWEGVQCDNATGRVTKLGLPCSLHDHITTANCEVKKSQCLTGQLHLSLLLQLEFLIYLDLSNQNFRSIINNDHGDVTNCNYFCENSSSLHYLDLSYNEDLHFGSLDWLSRVPSLKYVNFSGINLRGRVDWHQLATLLPFLTELHFDNCQLSDISPSLRYTNFTSLQVLSLADNGFDVQFLPHWLFNLSDLRIVDLRYNFLQGKLPERLLNLKKIRRLRLKSNKLTGPIPNWLGQLELLEVLDLSHNSFYCSMPSTLGNISSLIILDVRTNYLNGSLPKSLGQLLKLKALFFDDNHLTGYVTERNLAKLSNLHHLSMGSPSLNFDFDSLWVPTFQLVTIQLRYLGYNQLPPWIHTQVSLTSLTITHSIISFEPQDKFWDFVAQVPHIRIKYNTIHGNMPNVLLNSTTISLLSNKIKGNLPQLSTNVVTFNVAKNSFEGPISSFLCQKMDGTSQLQYLNMARNHLSGELTNCWMHWRSLVIVNLGGNNLTGTIPPSISLLSNLMVLRLYKNNLFGEMPLALRNCRKLQILDIGDNKFSGFLPNWTMKNMKILRLRSNQFSGNVPLQICKLASLVILDFANNKISGSLPTCLWNLTAMTFPNSSNNGLASFCIRIPSSTYKVYNYVMVYTKGQGSIYDKNLKFLHVIDLSSNNISGSIPPEIFGLVGLQCLNLSHNEHDGNIPMEISNMTNLESLDLSCNQLGGEIPPSMSNLAFLETLNLSFNNFTGRIPVGTQLQGFDAQSFIGNPDLCGAPLPKNCTTNKAFEPNEGNDSQEDEFQSSFYIALGVGFAMAFWGVCVGIFFNKNLRNTYFGFLNLIGDKLYIIVVLRMNRFGTLKT